MPTKTEPAASGPERPDPSALRILLEQLAADCTARGKLLTPLRREVYELLLLRGGEARVDGLLDDMRSRHARVAPMTIYRALDFLVQSGYVTRSEQPTLYRVVPRSGN
jgi:Fur family zinc uptake transcriptional regulator